MFKRELSESITCAQPRGAFSPGKAQYDWLEGLTQCASPVTEIPRGFDKKTLEFLQTGVYRDKPRDCTQARLSRSRNNFKVEILSTRAFI